MTSAWTGRRVLVTGHTGFKGAWLCLYLEQLGARVTGYALPPATDPNLFDLLGLDAVIDSVEGDVRDLSRLTDCVARSEPEVVFHLAAQSLVRESYRDPVGTYETNVMGTVNLLQAVSGCSSVKALVNVTTDKCYENREREQPYRESDRLGGRDPYSSSKACSELVTDAWRQSFGRDIAMATARAGNVIGGGDWSQDRLVPDAVRAIAAAATLAIRHPEAVRPWQHVLEPLTGYLVLAEALLQGRDVADAWNFGPDAAASASVSEILERVQAAWPGVLQWQVDEGEHPHEARLLALDSSRAVTELDWRRRLDLDQAIGLTCDWYRACAGGADVIELTRSQISHYQTL